jgi:hypothetical protein
VRWCGKVCHTCQLNLIPATMAQTVTTESYTLNCWVSNTDPNEEFSVSISKTANVISLREEIKKARDDKIGHLEAARLILYDVHLIATDTTVPVNNIDLRDARMLKPRDVLNQIYQDNPNTKSPCIIVQIPQGECRV